VRPSHLARCSAPHQVPGALPLTATDGLYFSGIGRSFFEQCLPRSSVDICTSFTAMHWLSSFPTALPDSAHHTQSAAAPQLALFATQAAADWSTVMTHRAAELRKGGQGVIASFGVSPEGAPHPHTSTTSLASYIPQETHRRQSHPQRTLMRQLSLR
jgi:hypothetical protein